MLFRSVPKAADVMSSARKNIAEITSLEAKTLFEMKMDVTEGAETMPVEMSITENPLSPQQSWGERSKQ